MHSNHIYTGRVIFQIEGDQRGRELTQEHLLAYNGLVGWGRNAVLVPTCHMAMSMLEVLTRVLNTILTCQTMFPGNNEDMAILRVVMKQQQPLPWVDKLSYPEDALDENEDEEYRA